MCRDPHFVFNPYLQCLDLTQFSSKSLQGRLTCVSSANYLMHTFQCVVCTISCPYDDVKHSIVSVPTGGRRLSSVVSASGGCLHETKTCSSQEDAHKTTSQPQMIMTKLFPSQINPSRHRYIPSPLHIIIYIYIQKLYSYSVCVIV